MALGLPTLVHTSPTPALNAIPSSLPNCCVVMKLRLQTAATWDGHALALRQIVPAGLWLLGLHPACVPPVPAGAFQRRDHVAGRRAAVYLLIPHVPALTTWCACQMRTGDCS